MSEQRLSWKQWQAAVDELCFERVGCAASDLPDIVPAFDYYKSDLAPEDFVSGVLLPAISDETGFDADDDGFIW